MLRCPARPAGPKGVLPRRQRHKGSPLNLTSFSVRRQWAGKLMPKASVSRGEYGLTRPVVKEFLDGVPEDRQHPGVVGGQPAQQSLRAIVVRAPPGRTSVVSAAPVDHLGDPGPLRLWWSAAATTQALFDGGVAPGAEKMNVMAGSRPGAVQRGDDVGARAAGRFSLGRRGG